MSGTSMLIAVVREVQVPLLAALLLAGGAAKARQSITAGTAGAATGPTAIFPLRLRRPVAIALCASEFALGAGLLLTAGTAGAGAPALVVRTGTLLLFCTAVGALYELRIRRPEAGCGCFGELSRTPVTGRVITRTALLTAAALSLIGAPPLRMPGSAAQAWLTLAAAAAEVALLALLSPEVGQAMARLGHCDPCEVRDVPVARTLSALRASAAWRRYQRAIVAAAPTDVWREGCWRFAVFPAELSSRPVDVVFAIHLADRHGPVRVGILDSGTNPAPQQPARPATAI